MDELVRLFKTLSGKTEPNFYDAIIAVTFTGDKILLYADCDFDIFDGPYLDDNLTDKKNVPEKMGIYKCKIGYYGYQTNIPEDPVEYDVSVWIEDVVEHDISKTWLQIG
jgi:hypothetical protein